MENSPIYPKVRVATLNGLLPASFLDTCPNAEGGMAQLAAQAHVQLSTLNHAPTSGSVQRYLREALRVIRAATDLSSDVEKALFWYRNEPLQPSAALYRFPGTRGGRMS